jgi:excisionase family DNA binding protein
MTATHLRSETVDHLRRKSLLSPEQLADYLGVPLATVYRWRTRGGGPRGVKVGKHVRYRDIDIEQWLESVADPKR